MGIGSLAHRFSPRKGVKFFTDLKESYGLRILVLMSSIHVGSKGGNYQFSNLMQVPYYRYGGHEGSIQQRMFAISVTPWIFKGFLGTISDLFPLLGYQKKWYSILFSLLGSVACIILGLLPQETVKNAPLTSSFLFFFLFLQSAALDLYVEAKAAELIKMFPNTKGDLITFAWYLALIGELIPAALIGPISDSEDSDPRILLFILLPFAAQPLIFLFLNCMVYDRVAPERANKFDYFIFRSQKKVLTIAFLQSSLSLVTIIFAFIDDQLYGLVYMLIFGTVVAILGFWLLPLQTAKFNLWMYLHMTCWVNLQGTLEYFYLADDDCVVDGHNFSFVQIKTTGHLLGVAAQIFGLIVFQVLFSYWHLKLIFLITTLIRIVSYLSDLFLVNFWNRSIGIPDYTFYLIFFSFFYWFSFQMNNYISLYMLSKLSPKDIESTMLAFLSSHFNWGFNNANYLGSYMMDSLGIVTIPDIDNGIQCNFDNINSLIIIGHFILPAIPILLIPFLVPDAYTYTPLVDVEHQDIKKIDVSKNSIRVRTET